MLTNTDTAAAPDYSGPDYGMGDDNALAHEIASFDPLGDTSGAHAESSEALRKTDFLPTVSALPPAMRDPIIARLQGLQGDQRAKLEAQLVTDAIRQRALDVRVMQGPGPNADAYQRERFEMANRLRLIDDETTRIMAELNEFDGYTTEIDQKTGEPLPKKIYRLSGEARSSRELRLAQLTNEAAHIEGDEGKRRAEAALAEAVAQRKTAMDEIAILHEAKARGAANAREERVERLSAGFASNLRHTF